MAPKVHMVWTFTSLARFTLEESLVMIRNLRDMKIGCESQLVPVKGYGVGIGAIHISFKTKTGPEIGAGTSQHT
jgi:hypothetical protein